MTAARPGKETIERELQKAVQRLHGDIERVEFWTDALNGFAKPIPGYEASDGRLSRFVLPQAKPDDGSGGKPDGLEK